MCLSLVAAGSAHAMPRPSGAVSLGATVRDHDVGGSALVDLWEGFGGFRLGGALGVAAGPSNNAQRSRVFMPVGLSAAWVVQSRRLGFDLRGRAGMWAGATSSGLALGEWLAAGASVEYALDPSIALAVGVEGWFLFGHGDAAYVVPDLSLVWTLGGG